MGCYYNSEALGTGSRPDIGCDPIICICFASISCRLARSEGGRTSKWDIGFRQRKSVSAR